MPLRRSTTIECDRCPVSGTSGFVIEIDRVVVAGSDTLSTNKMSDVINWALCPVCGEALYDWLEAGV